MNRLIFLTVLFGIIGLEDCFSQTNEEISLSHILKEIDNIETASYNSTNYFCYSGDTIPIGDKNYEYYKEYTLSSDTSVGASYVKFDLKDTTQMSFAYDGNIRARINWEKHHYEIDNFSKNPWPYRTVMAPFFAKSKSIIEYAINTTDSIRIDSTIYDDFVVYRISVFDERIEFVGRLPIHINELGSNLGITSEYVLWIDKETLLPYKHQRTLPSNTIIEEINKLKINNLDISNFSISNYIPYDMPRRTKEEKTAKKNLLNSLAYNWELPDLDNEFHNLTDVSSDVYMINYTSLFCGICRMLTPYLKQLSGKFNRTDFSFVSLYNKNEKKGLLDYVSEKKLDYNILLADKQTVDFYGFELTPTFVFLDENKIVRKIIYGYQKGKTEAEIEQIIKELL